MEDHERLEREVISVLEKKDSSSDKKVNHNALGNNDFYIEGAFLD